MNQNPLAQNWRNILAQIRSAEHEAERKTGSVALLAVGKTFPAQDIETLYRAGQRDFGENYVREWQDKAQALHSPCPDLVWHIIGHVQSNKTRAVAEGAAWLHTLDRAKTARRLNEQRPPDLLPLQVCLEINISGNPAKHGIAPDDMLPLAHEVATLPNLHLRGLMCVPSAHPPKFVRAQFQEMARLFARLQQDFPQADTLSMGMSGDLVEAVAHGSTMVRIGSAIFGKR
ncbi:YggS family pyridoxal phosphate-dependent enzyme [Conchiformibius kuhniae]|uniref:Pyridoxal phosphate homeostasis protein n=1 Tax=Conchiformibius kuhniae TaxID=211502 RepID=A0A8T9MSP8_9NEIS|nr:YggS family pyridoxal phosphate-dependent enzyme [Conchiformibius kuhniae]UOP04104.1 YggS family pyridoxal phosphate-dependent enzyme [Conchiformibius kuhniae]